MLKTRESAKDYYVRGIRKCYAQKNYRAAIKDFDKAIRLNPNYAPYYQYRGRAWERLGELKRAIKDFDEAIRLNPGYARAYQNRARAWEKLGNVEGSVKNIKEARRLNPRKAKSNPSRRQKWHFNGAISYEVIRVVDGDTILINYGGTEIYVRLLGVDAPETVHPDKPLQHYGREATVFLTNLLKGERIYFGFGFEEKDRYGRMLAFLYRADDGLFVNREIIRQGYGKAVRQYNYPDKAKLIKLEGLAQAAKKGIWAASSNRKAK